MRMIGGLRKWGEEIYFELPGSRASLTSPTAPTRDVADVCRPNLCSTRALERSSRIRGHARTNHTQVTKLAPKYT